MRIESRGMSRGEVATALTGAILAEGLGADIIDNLHKSKAGGGEIPLEPEVRAVIEEWERRNHALLKHLEQNLDDWVAFKQGLVQNGLARIFFPYLPKRRRIASDPNLDDLREASWLVMEHYRLASGFGSGHWEGPYQDVFIKANLALPLVDLAGLAYQAYQAGRGIPYTGTRPDLHAATFAAAHAGAFITGVGNRAGTLLLQKGVATLEETYHDTIAQHIVAHLRGEDPLHSHTWEHLANTLQLIIGEADLKRDMDRIAATETRWAYNVGRVQYMVERGVKRVFYLVQPSACPKCKQLFLKRDGTPKQFALSQIVRDIALHGGLNAGRTSAELRPSALTHPWCHCTPWPVGEEVPAYYSTRVREEVD